MRRLTVGFAKGRVIFLKCGGVTGHTLERTDTCQSHSVTHRSLEEEKQASPAVWSQWPRTDRARGAIRPSPLCPSCCSLRVMRVERFCSAENEKEAAREDPALTLESQSK